MEEMVCVEGAHMNFCCCFWERGFAGVDMFGGFGLEWEG